MLKSSLTEKSLSTLGKANQFKNCGLNSDYNYPSSTNLEEESLEKYMKSLGNTKDQLKSDIEALESTKEELTLKVEKIYCLN